jgi:hypothetical protein
VSPGTVCRGRTEGVGKNAIAAGRAAMKAVWSPIGRGWGDTTAGSAARQHVVVGGTSSIRIAGAAASLV